MANMDEDDNYEFIEFVEADSDEETNSQNDTSSDDDEEQAPAEEFDIRLTASHGYLTGTEAVPGKAIYIEVLLSFRSSFDFSRELR